MSLFGKIKNKAIGKKDDMSYEEVRSHILGDMPLNEEPPPQDRRFAEPEEEFPMTRRGREPIGIEPLQSDFREPIAFEPRSNDNYDVIDRLKFIENQLSAIKSQTETINERLKNIEMKLSRRY